jgi:prepilin-type N-terminal cleavage/methylation domain-containing protein
MNIWKRSPSRSSDGFTLIEMLVVVVIVGVLGAIAAPGWLSFINRQRVVSVKSDLLNVIKEVQVEAKQRSSGRTVIFKNLAQGPAIEVKNAAGLVVNTQPLGTNVKQVSISGFVGNTTVSANVRDSISFNNKGEIDSSSVPFTVKVKFNNTTATQCVIVTTVLGGLSEAKDSECDNPNNAT